MSRRLRLFPLNAVLFPGAALNLHVFEPRYKQMINECLESGEGFGVALIAEGAEAGDSHVTPHDIGSVAEIVDVQPLPFGRYFISTIGRQRFRIREIVSREPYLTVEVEMIEESDSSDDHLDALLTDVRVLFAEYLEMLMEFSGEEAAIVLAGDARSTSYIIGNTLQVAEPIKQRLLELEGVRERLRAEHDFLQKLLPQLRSLLERRRREAELRKERGEDNTYRTAQEQFFGKYFSAN
ncbi:MAG: LON peptidase substrate-binding domain-containing protein [Candidatus Eremiobacteraeota bacterium]|nr:LON peptidase substrate-binding domain-containing protein [Candidatus Eremiobacteraeota bacterium]